MSGRHRRPDPEEVAAASPPPPPAVPVPQPRGRAPQPGVRRRRDRAAERARRRAELRRRLLLGGAGTLALLLVAVLVVWLTGRGGGEADPSARTGVARQQTLLVQVTGADGVARTNALVGVTAKAASVVLVPSGLLVDVAGTGNVPFGETAALSEPSASAQALTDLVGVRVDGSWRLTAEGLAGLVDSVGGVDAAVDVDVLATDAQGNQTVVVRAGTQRLAGGSAAAYATYLAEGEPEQARLARFDDVLQSLAAKLPAEPAVLVGSLGALAAGSQSTLDNPALAQRLERLRAAAARDTLVSDVLPVTGIDSGGGAPTYGVDAGQVGAMMRARFPGALQSDAAGEVLRVLVENGVGTPGLVERAREKLVDAGFRFVNGGNAAEFTGDPSAVIVPDGTEASVRRGQRVAAALGLPESAVATSDRGQTVADVIVILGADFVP